MALADSVLTESGRRLFYTRCWTGGKCYLHLDYSPPRGLGEQFETLNGCVNNVIHSV